MALLREVRVDAGLTQKELGSLLNTDQSEVSHWETGEKRLDLIELCQIVDVLGIPLWEFIERFERMTGRIERGSITE